MSLTDSDGKEYIMIYNGELYNTEELRSELQKRGHIFNSYSDTEVLLRSFMTWKEKCLDKLVGMYAFAIWYEEELFLARDQLGVKPLFYSSLKDSKNQSEFVFASEMSALLCHPAIRSDVPLSRLETMVALMIVRMPGNVPFANVEELMPGHFIKVNAEGMSITKYWDLSVPSSSYRNSDMNEAAEDVHNLLREAVSSQIVSDVPFGCLLSGGIDSTAVTHFLSSCIEKRLTTPNTLNPSVLHTFSLQLPEYQQHFQSTATRRTNDEVYAKLVSEKYATRHHWISNKCSNTASLTEEVADAKCHPIFGDFDSSLFMMFKEIKDKGEATMLLSGEGSDEVFGGYHHIHWEKLVIPGGGLSAFYQSLLRDEWKYKFDLVGAVQKYYQRVVLNCPYFEEESDDDKEYRRRIYFHIKAFIPALLERKDLLSMASSIEVRVPFTDHRLVQYVFALPKTYNYNNGVEKNMLRKAMEREAKFPKEILEREKVPFPVSIDPQTERDGQALVYNLLNSEEDEPIFGIFDKTKVELASKKGFKSKLLPPMMPVNGVQTNLYSFNHWLKKYKVKIV
ncbi:Asparagine synthetase [glutamine-hydrolyzing] 3 [Pseudolycoriella hygida]|uniref:Asparagine synthetase [glutamine-hydrolyzing] n=1 Tax=Pseudolycoriella hygida TaxID=35572 RepID=A0A9Q0S5E8_9DIPT|nr:Asparagine synthetase [glutamine-hydrolyzing] 3 [Pseudolycoriella hygida]